MSAPDKQEIAFNTLTAWLNQLSSTMRELDVPSEDFVKEFFMTYADASNTHLRGMYSPEELVSITRLVRGLHYIFVSNHGSRRVRDAYVASIRDPDPSI